MRALVLWAEPASTNLGVRVLSEGSARLVSRAFGDVDFSYQGYGPGDAPVRIGSPRRQAARLLSFNDELTDWVRGFDLVLDTRAGDSFTDIYGLNRHFTMSLMHEIAVKAGVPVVLGPQTVGPFATRRGQWLASRTLRSASLVMARDDLSFGVAQRMGASHSHLTTDVVFALDQPVAGPTRDVVLNVSGLLWIDNPHVDHQHYRRMVRGVVTALQERGRSVTLLAHVLDSPLPDNDVAVVGELASELDLEHLVPDDLDDVRAALAGAQVMIGSRMHACLNALSVGTPAIPLAYSRKFAPLFDRIGWTGTLDLRDGSDVVEPVTAAVESEALSSRALKVRERAAQDVAAAVEALARVV